MWARIDAKRRCSNDGLWSLETLCTETRLRMSVGMYRKEDGNEGLNLDSGADVVMSGMVVRVVTAELAWMACSR